MTTLHLVRHGRPRADPARPAVEWTLDEAVEGLDVLRTSGALPTAARWFSSPEPKARATARALTSASVSVVEGLSEAYRGAFWFEDEQTFEAVVLRSLSHPGVAAHADWEPASQTQSRVVTAVDRIMATRPGDSVVLVGHATAWTLLVAALTDQPPDLEAWCTMRMPDHCSVRLERRVLESPWGAWQPGTAVAAAE